MKPLAKNFSEVDWNEIKRLFDQCVEGEPEKRISLLRELKKNRPHVAEELESLLKAHDAELISGPTEAVPESFGKYRVVRKLGSGGMADVYLAETSGPGQYDRRVAVKLLLPAKSDRITRRLFEHEAKLMSQLSHTNIVTLYDFVPFGETCLLILEYVPGKNLAELCDSTRGLGKKIPIDCCLYIISELLKALDYAHNKKDGESGKSLKLVHRDVTPNNVIISFEGIVKLLDFGIAKSRNRGRVTRTGMLRGTMRYLAPERWRGKDSDQRSDLYSVAVILYELIFGSDYESEGEVSPNRKQKIHKKIQAPEISEPLRRILRKGLAWNVDDRYASAAEFLADVQRQIYETNPLKIQQRLVRLLGEATNSTPLKKDLIESGGVSVSEKIKIWWSRTGSSRRFFPVLDLKRFLFLSLFGVSIGMAWTFFSVVDEASESLVVRSPSSASVGICTVRLSTIPKGAQVWVDGESFGGKTPLKLDIPCRDGVALSLHKKDYTSIHYFVRTTVPQITRSFHLKPGIDGSSEKFALLKVRLIRMYYHLKAAL